MALPFYCFLSDCSRCHCSNCRSSVFSPLSSSSWPSLWPCCTLLHLTAQIAYIEVSSMSGGTYRILVRLLLPRIFLALFRHVIVKCWYDGVYRNLTAPKVVRGKNLLTHYSLECLQYLLISHLSMSWLILVRFALTDFFKSCLNVVINKSRSFVIYIFFQAKCLWYSILDTTEVNIVLYLYIRHR